MTSRKGQIPFLQELSGLEVEPLEIVVNAPEPEQDSSLDTLTPLGDIEIAALLTGKGAFPANAENCCCCCTVCCCC
jgi:hypothetical protein